MVYIPSLRHEVVSREAIMRFFTGQYERSIDEKNRIQLPSPLRSSIQSDRDGAGLYVTLGEDRRTLSIFTERGFEELSSRIETESMPSPESARFELQFFSLACFVEMDPQGRFVLPDRLMRKAKLGREVFLIGRKKRIDIWDRVEFERAVGIDWDGEDWPDWQGFLRMKPNTEPK